LTNIRTGKPNGISAWWKPLLTLCAFGLYHQNQMPETNSTLNDAPVERIFLIDSMSHIFRAFFAPMGTRAEPLTNSQGQVTQAVFIFTSMLRKLLQDEKPHYVAAVFESGEKTFRHDNFADYKANRAAMPEELESQLPYIVRVCEALNVPILSAPTFEADDVIGTLAVKAAERGMRSVIVSNDKDMCQLVRDPWVVCMRQNSQNINRSNGVTKLGLKQSLACHLHKS
jgi:DNA polymerase-1